MTQQPLALGDLDGPAGAVELAAVRSVEAAYEAQILEPADQGLAALVVTLARVVDRQAAARNARGVALLAKELRETAGRLRLDPTSRGEAQGDAFTELLTELKEPSRPTVGDPAQP